MIYLIIYILGYLSTFWFLSKFGVMLGLDYDNNKSSIDDYTSNAQAYTVFSFLWPIVGVILLIFLFFSVLMYLGGLYHGKYDK